MNLLTNPATGNPLERLQHMQVATAHLTQRERAHALRDVVRIKNKRTLVHSVVERSAAASILDVDAGALANEVLDNIMVVLLSSIMECYRSLILLFRRMRLHVHICSSFHQRFDAPATPTTTHNHEAALSCKRDTKGRRNEHYLEEEGRKEVGKTETQET